MKKIHIYNTKGQKVCSKEFDKNNHNTMNYSFKDIANLDMKMVCKKCARKIGKPYFDDDRLSEMYQSTD